MMRAQSTRAKRTSDVQVEAGAQGAYAETADANTRPRRAEDEDVRAGFGGEHGFILAP